MSDINAVKAVRVEVEIGSVQIVLYQMPNGSYEMAGTSVTDAIGEPRYGLVRYYGVKTLNDLPGAGLGLYQVRSEAGGRPIVPVKLPDALKYWMARAVSGNAIAAALMLACAEETIERRADRKLGVQRSEEERDSLLKVRMSRITARLGWTNVIKRDQEHRGIYLTDLGSREFASLTRMVNRRLFGVSDFNNDRDNMDLDQQLDITAFERLLIRKYREGMDLGRVIYDCLDFYQSVQH